MGTGEEGRLAPNDRSARGSRSLPLLHSTLAVGSATVLLAAHRLRIAAPGGLAGRALIGAVFGGLLVAAAFGAGAAPRAVAQLPPSFDPAAVSASISPIQTGWGTTQPIVVRFSAPMDVASVESALDVSPAADVRLSWDASGSLLSVAPVVGWTPGTVYTVTVGDGARALAGADLEPMLPAIVFIRPPATASLSATKLVGDRLALDSGFRMLFSRPVDLAALRDAFTIEPAVDGTLAFEGSAAAMPAVVWVPDEPLAADTVYTVGLAPTAVDLEGAPLEETPSLTLRTISRPDVVRFRPRDGTKDVDPGQTLSVRFTEAMDHATTRAAYHLYAVAKDGKRNEVDLSKAKVTWAEESTVLVVDPQKSLTNGTTYVTEVDAGARSRTGAAVFDDPDDSATATFTVVPKPSAPAATPRPGSGGGGGGGGGTSRPWLDAEKYYLSLLNCTHTGGWLQWDGSCPGRGSNGLPPLVLDPALSDCASRPWSKYLAETNQFYHGDVGGRFDACGYNVYWGENLTHNTYDVYTGAISSVIFFQNERGTSYTGHYDALMNPRFTHAGIGIWRLNGWNYYTVDFWGY